MSGWISVEERLPEEYTTVLVSSSPIGVELGWRISGVQPMFVEEHSGSGIQDVTHWQPLPEPPEVG